MVTRICISINNRCNLNCKYCHFHEKSDHIISSDMNVYSILDNVKTHIEKYDIPLFKIGFVGNGEPLLDYPKLKEYIVYIGDYLKNGVISAYTITNGLLFDEDILHFFREYNVNVGFSIDGIKEIHDKWRCNSFDTVLKKIELYHKIYICGNCVDLPTKFTVDTPIDEMNFNIQPFDRQFCYKEGLK